MTNILKNLLEIDKPLFDSGLAALEKSTGHSGVDIRLIADILEKSHRAIRSLGLDTTDTTGHELYGALTSSVKSGKFESVLCETDYCLLIVDKKLISFNLIDVIENYHHGLSYQKQIVSHGQRSLTGELVKRYFKHTRTNNRTTREIAESMGLLHKRDE